MARMYLIGTNSFLCIIFMMGTVWAQMGIQEYSAFNAAQNRGKYLAKYDSCARVAADFAVALRVFDDTSNISLSVCIPERHPPTVYYGKLNDSLFNIAYKAELTSDGCHALKCDPVEHDSEVSKRAIVLKDFIGFNKPHLDSIRIPQNFYVLSERDTTYAYFWPATVRDNLILLAGAFKAKYVGNPPHRVSNMPVHLSTVELLYPPPKDSLGRQSVGPMRGSLLNVILSEVDAAQCIIYRKKLPRAFIVTKAYVFDFKYDEQADTYAFSFIKRRIEAGGPRRF